MELEPAQKILQKCANGRKLSVCSVGAGYVGSLTAITMAVQNPNVDFTVCDINCDLIGKWQREELPFFEPNLDDYYKKARSQGNLEFTTECDRAIREADVIFISVNTPPKKSAPLSEPSAQLGIETDMRAFFSVVANIAKVCNGQSKIIVEKSTVPINTARQTIKVLTEASVNCEVVSMPEFLAEGSAIRDLVYPQRVVIGTKSDEAFELLKQLCPRNCPIIRTIDTASSELGKLMANAMLAQRVSSINSLTALCEQTPGCSIKEVKQIIASDKRIGDQFLQCSLGFGGSCFDKDLASLVYILKASGNELSAKYWQGVLDVNVHQKHRLAQLVIDSLPGSAMKIALFGFSYKKNTSDTRSTPSVVLTHKLMQRFQVAIHDP